jgi:hypothetical protein
VSPRWFGKFSIISKTDRPPYEHLLETTLVSPRSIPSSSTDRGALNASIDLCSPCPPSAIPASSVNASVRPSLPPDVAHELTHSLEVRMRTSHLSEKDDFSYPSRKLGRELLRTGVDDTRKPEHSHQRYTSVSRISPRFQHADFLTLSIPSPSSTFSASLDRS